jgi:hypothetical protein
MRTTLTIDDDIAVALERLRKIRDATLKDLVNDALRRGLSDLAASPRRPRVHFETDVVSLGKVRLPNIDNVSDALAAAEGEAFK